MGRTIFINPKPSWMTASAAFLRDVKTAANTGSACRQRRRSGGRTPPRGVLFFCYFSFGRAKEK